MRAARGTRLDLHATLQAITVDRLSQLVWMKTKDGVKGRRRPKSLYAALNAPEKRMQGGDMLAFTDAASFEATRAAMLKEVTT